MRAGQSRPHTVVIGCGALGRELVALTADLPGVDVTCLPALLHNRPDRIPAAVADRIAEARRLHGADIRLFVAYADCGTGGMLDTVLADAGVERLAGAHCYEVYAGSAVFSALQDAEPGTFYLTDFLARQFDALVWAGLGLDRHPQLLSTYFGNYRRLVYLAQTDDPALTAAAVEAASRLGLDFERRFTGFGELGLVRTRASLPPVRHASSGRRLRVAARRSAAEVSQERLTEGQHEGLPGSPHRRVRVTRTGGRKARAPAASMLPDIHHETRIHATGGRPPEFMAAISRRRLTDGARVAGGDRATDVPVARRITGKFDGGRPARGEAAR